LVSSVYRTFVLIANCRVWTHLCQGVNALARGSRFADDLATESDGSITLVPAAAETGDAILG
jgi:hypothetical protein